MDLLWVDAKRVAEFYHIPFEESLQRKIVLMRTYEILIKRAASKEEFPRLYKWAWIVLTKCIENNEWDTLEEIYGIYGRMQLYHEVIPAETGTFLEWHLKSILYCWLYLPPEGPLDSKAKRSEESVTKLISLLSQMSVYLNLLPREAEKKLISQRLNTHSSSFQKPFLFRLSTNDPGIVTITFRTPFSDRLAHRRILDQEEIQLWLKNDCALYRTLFFIAVDEYMRYKNNGNDKESVLFSRVDVLKFLKQPLVDYYLDKVPQTRDAIRIILEKEFGEKLVSLNRDLYHTLYPLCYSNYSELLMQPQTEAERLGLSENYLHSYQENSHNSSSSLLVGSNCIEEASDVYCMGFSFDLVY